MFAVHDQQRDEMRKWSPIGRVTAPATTKSSSPRSLGEGAEVIFDMIFGQGLKPGAQRHLAGKRQTSQADQLFVLDKNAVQRDTPARRQAGRRVDRGADFRGGIERNDDAFDPLGHQWLWVMAALRASSAALAAKASSLAAMR